MLMRIFITVKTYPTLSISYDELVCIAGINEEGKWIRLYPIPFRKLSLDKRFSKYQWIEINVERNLKDFRPESYRPIDLNVKTLEKVSSWTLKKKICLQEVYTDLKILINEAKNPSILKSLATFKPLEILDFYWKEDEREWDLEKLRKLMEKRKQLKFNMFDYLKDDISFVKKVPYKFKYKFKDINGEIYNLEVLDWEVGQLYWKCYNKLKNEDKALEKVREKYFDNFVKNRDLYFFLGTTKKYHKRSKNPFIIVGVFYPPKEKCLNLF